VTWLRIFAVILLVTVLVFSVTEIFDTWDNTVQTGDDLDFNTVLLALCLGAVLASIRLIARLLTLTRGSIASDLSAAVALQQSPEFLSFVRQASLGSFRI
jgi:TRAP-type C4-dicarboxylate transport system permease small subunit